MTYVQDTWGNILHPCPKCGGEPDETTNHGHTIVCTVCGYKLGLCDWPKTDGRDIPQLPNKS